MLFSACILGKWDVLRMHNREEARIIERNIKPREEYSLRSHTKKGFNSTIAFYAKIKIHGRKRIWAYLHSDRFTLWHRGEHP